MGLPSAASQEVLSYEAGALLPEERNAVRIAAHDIYGFSARSKGPKSTRRLVVTKSGKSKVSAVVTESADPATVAKGAQPKVTTTPSGVGSDSNISRVREGQPATSAASNESCVQMPPQELPPSAPHSEECSRWPTEYQDQQKQLQSQLYRSVGI